MPVLSVVTAEGVRTYSFTGTPTVRELLQRNGVSFALPCSGGRRCGKCKLRCQGELSPPLPEETAFLPEEERRAGIRLACFARVLGDVTVYPGEETPAALTAIVLPRHELTERGWGLAADIGTTTVAMQLYRLETGELRGEALGGNRQAAYGADVISRIDYTNHNGGAPLQQAIHGQLEEMARDCMAQAGCDRLDRAVVTGNTTMLHFWEGLDASGIAVAPFIPASLFGDAGRCGLTGVLPLLPPCVGAYIGADVTCGVLASGMLEEPDKTALLADLGTNGELALYHRGTLYCASTAMGPAFEGAGLAFGMQALPGAIRAVRRKGDDVSASVLGDREAVGLCGSGVLDAVRVMLELEVLDETGAMQGEGLCEWNGQTAWQIPGTVVYVTQKDVRQIQLAKAALHAGILTLLETLDLEPEDIDRFFIAGGFGHYMDLESAAAVGLLPPALAEKAELLGNAALSGAAALLLDRKLDGALRQVQAAAQEIPLSGNQMFSGYYVEQMLFGDDF